MRKRHTERGGERKRWVYQNADQREREKKSQTEGKREKGGGDGVRARGATKNQTGERQTDRPTETERGTDTRSQVFGGRLFLKLLAKSIGYYSIQVYLH